MFGMRYITPGVPLFSDKPLIVIRDLSQRRCLRASNEERDESDVIYKEMRTWSRYSDTEPYPRGILKRVLVPENIDLYPNAKLSISEDNIVVIEDVRH